MRLGGSGRPERRVVLLPRAVGRVVQVVELARAGVAGFEHLHVQLRGDIAQQLGREARGHRVHRLAPGPERILGIALAFGHAGHRALEGMRMQIGDAGQPPTGAGGFDAMHACIVAQQGCLLG